MTKFQTLLAGTALATFAALPALSQEVGVAATLDAAATVTALEQGEARVGVDAGQVITAGSEAFVGNPVVTNDGSVVGTVDKAAVTAEGNTVLLISMDPAAGAEADAFTLLLAASETADGEVNLGWTKAELLGTLSSQINADKSSG